MEIMILLLVLLPVLIVVGLIVMGFVVAQLTKKQPTADQPKAQVRGSVVSGCGLALIVLPMVSMQFMFLGFIGPPIGLVMLVIGMVITARQRTTGTGGSRQS